MGDVKKVEIWCFGNNHRCAGCFDEIPNHNDSGSGCFGAVGAVLGVVLAVFVYIAILLISENGERLRVLENRFNDAQRARHAEGSR